MKQVLVWQVRKNGEVSSGRVIPFPGVGGRERTAQESTVTQWSLEQGRGTEPVSITMVSSGFGKPATKTAAPQACMSMAA